MSIKSPLLYRVLRQKRLKGHLMIQERDLNAELNPICHLQALLGAHIILHVFRIRVKLRLFSKSKKTYNEI